MAGPNDGPTDTTKLLFDIGPIFNKTLFDHSCRDIFLKEKELRYRAVLTEICLILPS